MFLLVPKRSVRALPWEFTGSLLTPSPSFGSRALRSSEWIGSSRLISSAYHTWPARSSLPVHGDDLDNATSELKGR